MITLASAIQTTRLDTNSALTEVLAFFRDASTFSIIALCVVLIIAILTYYNIKKGEKKERNELSDVIKEHKENVVEYNRSLSSLANLLSTGTVISERREDKMTASINSLENDIRSLSYSITDMNMMLVEIKTLLNNDIRGRSKDTDDR